MGIGPILDIQCTGNEDSLDSCTVSNNDRNYDHSNDAGVICLPLFVGNLCTNQTFFNSVCKVDTTTGPTIGSTACTCPGGTSPNSGTQGVVDITVLAVPGAFLGITIIVLICVVLGWVITCIIMKKKLNNALMSKNM